ncbi:MAG TPA: tRNA uridine-5-carboxymethylaminomethyl(34) synthesis GTPase MnmE [Candidatus Aminicenantes bacterium]|nr:MAG: tRNA uridine-5-carboxymethylaminomethyl(34) synthesis GTPase MnmE [Candidatus Aminicenantes bacterium]HEK86435.1 tRNA uridine-5-carboxymethylaminomethyl(34) synthesis GTPase MnmE [Candidatus Aminicenantes bacterium]
MNPNLEDTIIAVSTPPGSGGIGIVRISGPKALDVARQIFQVEKNNPAENPRTLCFGYLLNSKIGEKLDAGYLCYFPAPGSYTREDVVEINLHGSPVLLSEAVKLGIEAGARLAHPGEFTLRAYLNGRIDIIQAEAVNDLIRAVSLDQAKISFRQLEGSLSKRISNLREQLVEVLVLLETILEFPDEDVEISRSQIKAGMKGLIDGVEQLIKSYEQGRALLEGLTIALLGKTNVGKSTLFNALLEEERSIVTPYPGTTRDFIRENINVNGVLMRLVDMAGFGLAQHPVEEEGIIRSQKIAEQADGLLIILDSSREESEEDFYLLEKFQQKKSLIVFNKCDLEPKIDKNEILKRYSQSASIDVSALKGINLENLKTLMLQTFSPTAERQDDIILHEHQKILLEKIKANLEKSGLLLEEGFSEELVAEELKEALPVLGQLTGEIKSQEIIEQIFNRFCIGK